MGFHHFAHAGVEFLDSSDLSASTSQSARIIMLATTLGLERILIRQIISLVHALKLAKV